MSTFVIVGAGMMGSAMTFPAACNHHDIRLVGTPYDRAVIDQLRASHIHPALKTELPASVQPLQFEELDQALQDADLLISGVPSFGTDWFAENVLARIPDSLVTLSLTKGLHDLPDGTLLPISQAYLVHPALQGRHLTICSIGGPCISHELCRGLHTTVALVGENRVLLQALADQLATHYYHIQPMTDVIGLESAIAMKNAYAVGVALAIGIAEAAGSPIQDNPQAALFGQSMREMMRLIALLGGSPESVVFAASDLYVTIVGGRNRQLGILLGKGLSLAQALEQLKGVTLESISIITHAARAIRRRHDATINDFPLLRHLDEIVSQNAPLNIPWHEFH